MKIAVLILALIALATVIAGIAKENLVVQTIGQLLGVLALALCLTLLGAA